MVFMRGSRLFSPALIAQSAPVTGRRDDKRREQEATRQNKLDAALERGLEDTFPGSDPVLVTQPAHSAADKYQAKKPQPGSGRPAPIAYPIDSAYAYVE